MPLALLSDNSVAISIGIYKPRRRFTTDHIVDHLSKISAYLETTGCVKSAILRSISNGSWGWVAVYTLWQTKDQAKKDAFRKAATAVAETVEWGWHEVSCGECKEGIDSPELSKGDVVNLRGILTEPERQDILSYSCLAVLKAYFSKIEGILSCTFYKSLDGKKIVGLGVWKDAQSAHAFMNSAEGSPAEPYWRSLGAKLKYGIYEVAYVTGD